MSSDIYILFGRWGVGTPERSCAMRAVATPQVRNPEELITAIRWGVTDWMRTDDGAAALHYAGSDFNVGDLTSYLDDTLRRHLSRYGVEGLVIEDFHEERSYDEPLANYVPPPGEEQEEVE